MCELYGKKWHSVDVLAMKFIPSWKVKLENLPPYESSFLTLQEQLSSLNVKKKHCSAPLVGTLSRVVATHAYEPFFGL